MKLFILQEIKNQEVKNTSNSLLVIFANSVFARKTFAMSWRNLMISSITNFSRQRRQFAFLSFTIEKHSEVTRFLCQPVKVNRHVHVYLIAYA